MTTCSNRRSHQAAPSPITASFEFFPPKSDKMAETLWQTVQRLAPLSPSFVSVTYGAGGSTRERTHRTVERILKETDLAPAAHLTCVGAARSEIDAIVKDYWDLGVRHLVALRGDPLDGIGSRYVPHPEGYAYATDLVEGVKKIANFDISVSGYPERHPESGNWQKEIDNLKRKVDAGADRIITQYFFDNDLFDDYLDRIAAAGINIPVIPGILPIHNFEQTMVFSAKCGTSIPQWLARRFAGLTNDPETRKLVGVSVACEQVMDLVDRGINDFHFYTMNRADLTFAICHMLGMGQPETKETLAA
ncbi:MULTISPECIES: methylenetetrahydrofolate reductase [NAD(P)H] [Stappiaceae]|jgi:methylenetetrahydrofolate reductase (NADPH)|uniref:Methylenetetrahydrofolate reductase n=1 Tax=Roseibium aggregatum TaxID=187304 RepID=A0A0M6Y0X7_9HYPH|nr:MULTISPECIES: methylenetetrahydrofolate reductase [NAD(P)H] [Stappiaceae]MCR9284434.1 methylenetetrahydrofolate reductase [NAD(P)H] [Paracoccaceae bacterium]MEC9470491.1 methylenetetrahydrofolate reductase [NAD(P)H] [Pseudomonadota bacterium]AMN52932.1 5,10-methylenetetrahydrofolate reductase [Labrenzia sp. CP4]ERP94083.1 5,10-methylenetetrahydrofolate reductase [Labrenzia sp. C1B10]ERS05090.1 5,10-methylenetetrahydrofolate reductase [Labrenzia sp. C1B70]